MNKKIISAFILPLLLAVLFLPTALAAPITITEAAINADEAIEVKKSSIFDASQSFLANPSPEATYEWDFGDGNRNEGIEVLHAYQEPGEYNVQLTINNNGNITKAESTVFAYNKMIILITDLAEVENRVELAKNFAKEHGVFINVIEGFGAATEFISEEILTKKLNEETSSIKKASQILIWTQENAGLNALSRFIQRQSKEKLSLHQKSINLVTQNINSSIGRAQRQFPLVKPKNIIVTQEGAIDYLIETSTDREFIETLENRGYEYEVITESSGQIRPWNFMSYFVNLLIEEGIPDNTIALLLLLPVIATVVAFMKQVVGITTFGIYTPSIITLSFFIISLEAGLFILAIALGVGALVRPLLKKIRMLYIPKMAIVITLVSIILLFTIIITNYLGLFDSQFLSIAIFPMLILSTLVEKFISAKSDKSLSSAAVLMAETILVSILAYFIAGGEIDLGIASFKFELIKNIILTYPETIILLLLVNLALGKWSGLRVLERIRFREVLRHIEE